MNLVTITDRCGINQESHIEGPLLAVRAPGLPKTTYERNGPIQVEVVSSPDTGHTFILHHASAQELLEVDGFDSQGGEKVFHMEFRGALYRRIMTDEERLLNGIDGERVKTILRGVIEAFALVPETSENA